MAMAEEKPNAALFGPRSGLRTPLRHTVAWKAEELQELDEAGHPKSAMPTISSKSLMLQAIECVYLQDARAAGRGTRGDELKAESPVELP
jgi:hypothetical protein